ncbi:MAG: short-chain dehydrogenase [Planctomycetaceae bacterium]|nr:short-chain dehydrogenase [Planctomycetaceae bacterium]
MSKTKSRPVFRPTALADRVVIVTGGGRGIGKGTALHLASLGAAVIVAEVREKLAKTFKADANKVSTRHPIVYVRADVTRAADLKRVVAKAKTTWGRIDGLVNNAMIPASGSIEMQTAAGMDRAWATNTRSAWQLVKLALPLMRERGGSVVNISSIMARQTTWPAAAYNSTKAALEGLTQALGVELASQEIRVNAVAPGHIETHALEPKRMEGVPAAVLDEYVEMVHRTREMMRRSRQPLATLGVPAHIADAVAFLLSDASAYMTGSVMYVDGGASCYMTGGNLRRAEEYMAIRQRVAELCAAHPALKTHRQMKLFVDMPQRRGKRSARR